MPSKKRGRGKSSEVGESQVQGETQFEPHELDHSETFWDVKCILNEKPGFYFVDWDGVDPATGKPWPPSWVAKTDCTDDLIREWKAAKRKKKEEAKAAKSAKSSTYSLCLCSEGVHIVLCSFTLNGHTPIIARGDLRMTDVIQQLDISQHMAVLFLQVLELDRG